MCFKRSKNVQYYKTKFRENRIKIYIELLSITKIRKLDGTWSKIRLQLKFNLESNYILTFRFLHSVIHLAQILKIIWDTWFTIRLQLKFIIDSNLIFSELWLIIYIYDKPLHILKNKNFIA